MVEVIRKKSVIFAFKNKENCKHGEFDLDLSVATVIVNYSK